MSNDSNTGPSGEPPRPRPFGEPPPELTQEYLERMENTLIHLQVKSDMGMHLDAGPKLLRLREAVDAFSEWCLHHGTIIPALAELGRTVVQAQCRDIEAEVALMREQLGLPEQEESSK